MDLRKTWFSRWDPYPGLPPRFAGLFGGSSTALMSSSDISSTLGLDSFFISERRRDALSGLFRGLCALCVLPFAVLPACCSLRDLGLGGRKRELVIFPLVEAEWPTSSLSSSVEDAGGALTKESSSAGCTAGDEGSSLGDALVSGDDSSWRDALAADLRVRPPTILRRGLTFSVIRSSGIEEQNDEKCGCCYVAGGSGRSSVRILETNTGTRSHESVVHERWAGNLVAPRPRALRGDVIWHLAGTQGA